MSNANSGKPEPLLTEIQAAEFLNLSPRTLQAWRIKGGGPCFARLGRAVRYRQADLNQWLDAQTLAHTSAAEV
ncbi:MAG: helix-turn-helix domain-containing protein [Parvibaculum sp.]|nr:helix-turn-helix domain-containing protein [Parvibaculum sp.]